MKKNSTKWMSVFTKFLLVMIIPFMVLSCKKDEETKPEPTPPPTPTTGQVSGQATLQVGVSGELSNAKVSLYQSLEDWRYNKPFKSNAVQGSGANVTFTISNINPGVYYLDIWKDLNNDGYWSNGDLIGVYIKDGWGEPNSEPTPFQVSAGETVNTSIRVFIYQGY